MGRDDKEPASMSMAWPDVQRSLGQLAADAASHPAVQQLGAAGLQLGAPAAAYNLTLAVGHVAAGVLRLHCATPLLGPLWGLGTVAAASAAAGHVSRSSLAAMQAAAADVAARRRRGDGGGSVLGGALAALPGRLAAGWNGFEAAEDAVLGVVLFRVVFRHDFRRLLPSHLAKPGAFGRLHIPTGTTEYSTPSEKAQLSVIFGRDGCHHCGTRRNGVIGDHMPPYKVVKDTLAAREVATGMEKFLTQAAAFLRLPDTAVQQVYYAQCKGCSGRQAQLMRNGTRTTLAPGLWPPELVLAAPARLLGRSPLPGVLVAARHVVVAAVGAGGAGGGGRDGGGGAAAQWGGGGGAGEGGKGGRGKEKDKGRDRSRCSRPDDVFAATRRLEGVGAELQAALALAVPVPVPLPAGAARGQQPAAQPQRPGSRAGAAAGEAAGEAPQVPPWGPEGKVMLCFAV